VNIRAVVLDKDDCFAVPHENEVFKPYKVRTEFLYISNLFFYFFKLFQFLSIPLNDALEVFFFAVMSAAQASARILLIYFFGVY